MLSDNMFQLFFFLQTSHTGCHNLNELCLFFYIYFAANALINVYQFYIFYKRHLLLSRVKSLLPYNY
jgi:hypothetical protein